MHRSSSIPQSRRAIRVSPGQRRRLRRPPIAPAFAPGRHGATPNKTLYPAPGSKTIVPIDWGTIAKNSKDTLDIWNRKVNTPGGSLMSKIEEGMKMGQTVPICMNGHAVLVTKVTDSTVYINNPWGSEEKFSRSYFARAVVGANILLNEPLKAS